MLPYSEEGRESGKERLGTGDLCSVSERVGPERVYADAVGTVPVGFLVTELDKAPEDTRVERDGHGLVRIVMGERKRALLRVVLKRELRLAQVGMQEHSQPHGCGPVGPDTRYARRVVRAFHQGQEERLFRCGA